MATTKKARALEQVVAAAGELERSQARVEVARARLRERLLAARKADPPATYEELAEASGLTRGRVHQITHQE